MTDCRIAAAASPFVVPSLDLVVAVVAGNGAGLDLLDDAILPAVTSS